MKLDVVNVPLPPIKTLSSDHYPVPEKTFVTWGPKGGTGKTTLTFNTAVEYAKQHPHLNVLVIDMDPQANLSHAFFGGGTRGPAHANLLMYQRHPQLQTARTVAGYILGATSKNATDKSPLLWNYVTRPYEQNSRIPDNVYLISGMIVLFIF